RRVGQDPRPAAPSRRLNITFQKFSPSRSLLRTALRSTIALGPKEGFIHENDRTTTVRNARACARVWCTTSRPVSDVESRGRGAQGRFDRGGAAGRARGLEGGCVRDREGPEGSGARGVDRPAGDDQPHRAWHSKGYGRIREHLPDSTWPARSGARDRRTRL